MKKVLNLTDGIKLTMPIFLILFLMACTRAEKDISSSMLRIEFPKSPAGENSRQALSIPAGTKACYGVMVSGPGIAPSVNVCGTATGTYVGFVEEGQSVSMTIPKGKSRTINVLLNLIPEGRNCRTWDMKFGATALQLRSTYMAGTVTGLEFNTDNATVDVPVQFPGVGNNVMVTDSVAPCLNTLHGQLLSNGDILDAAETTDPNLSDEKNISFFSSMVADIFNTGVTTAANELILTGSSPVAIPEFVYSVTRKPDTGNYYALVGEGKIVELTFNGSSFDLTELTSSTCPFGLTDCEVPPWAQSISAGFDQDLYVLDHEGTIYQIFADGTPYATGDIVGNNIFQISYY